MSAVAFLKWLPGAYVPLACAFLSMVLWLLGHGGSCFLPTPECISAELALPP